ncbi:MAG: trypsin-like peptidase domain-containing protein [Elusimicrobia bacterium]|nr:trypsin-like peptidase domain-containing protein [Elusimicrobiota bacterium]
MTEQDARNTKRASVVLNGKKILIIDDDVREEEAFKYADTRQATNKSEGLTMLQKAVDEGVPYSFILLDYQLHDEKMDYVDFVNEAKKISPGILVIGYSTGFGWKDEDLSVLDADTDKMLGDNFFNFIEERLGITAKQKERPVIDYGHKILDTKLPAGSKPSAAKIQMFVREYNRFNSSLDRVEPDGALSEVARTENYIKYLYSKQWENLQNLIRDGQRDEFIYNAMFYLNELPSRDRDVRLFSGLNRFEETKNILFSTVASEPEFGKDGKNRLLSELDVILNFDTYYPITIYELDLMKRAFEDTFQSSEDNKRLAKEVKNISERLNKVSPVLTNKFNKEELISPNDIFYARADILDDIQYIKSMLLGIWLSKDLDILSREKVDKILNINDRLSKEFPYALPDIWEYTTGWPVFLKKYVENSDFVVDEQERNYDPLAFFDNPLWRQEKIAIIERMLERLNSKLRGSQDTDAALRKKMDKISKQATNFLYNYYYAAADKLYKAEVEGRPIDAAKAKTYYNLIHYQRGMIKYEGRRFTAASDKLISNIFEIDKTLKGNRNYRDIIDEMRSMTPDFPSVESLSVPGGKSGYFTTGGLTPEGIENLFAGAGGFIKGLLLPLIGNRLPDIQTSVPVPMENSAASVPLQKSVGPLQSAPPVSAPVENSAVSTALQESAAPQQYAPPAYLSSKSKNTLEQERDIASVSPEIRKKAEAATFALVTHKGTSFANLTLVEFEINNKKEKYLVTSAHAADLDDMAFVRPKNWQKGDLPLLVKEFLRIPALDIVLFSVPEELDGVEPLKASEIPVQNGDKVYSLSVHNDNESAGHIQDIFSPGGILSSLWAAEIGTCGSAMLNSDGQVVGIRNKKTQHSGLSKYFSLPTGDFFPEDAPVGVISDYIKYKLYGIDSSRPVYVLGQRAFDIKTSQSLKDGYIYWYDEDGTIMAKGPNRALIAPEYKLVNNLESLLLLEDDFYKNGNYGIKLVLKNDNGSEDKIDIVIKGGKVIKVTTPALKEQAAPLSAPAENSAAGQNIFNLKNDGPLYMFDMDGTITPDHAPMTENTAAWLREFVKTHNVFIVTGTNYDHVVTQIPADIIDNLSGVYSSMGNELHVQNRVIYSKAFAGAPNLSDALDALLKDSGWTGARYNEHTKTAAGEIIFNVAGLDAPAEVLTAYKDWDARTGERADFAKRLSAQFPNLNVVLPKSGNIVIRDSFDGKETALKHARGILPDRKIIYAGNEEQAGGNDYGAAQFLQQQGNSEIYKISSAEEIPATFANPSSSAQNADLKNINKSWSKFTLFRLSENIKEFKSNLPKHGFKYAAGLFFTRTARWAAQTAVDFYRHRYEPRENYPRIAADGYELNIADLQSSPYASSVFYSPKKTASGFVVEYKGKVYGLASGHVFPFPGRTETIKSLSGKEYKVKVLASGSPYTLQAGVPDIAALELPPEALADFKPLPLADEDVKAGDTVDSPGFVKQDISMVPYFINNRIVLSNDGSKLITSYNFKDFFVGFCGSPLVLAREGTVVGLHKGSYYDRKNSLAVNLTVLKNFLDYVQTGAAPDYTITLAGGGTHAIPFNKVVRLSKDAEQNIKNLQAQSQTSAPATPAQTLPPPDYLTSKSEKTLEQERDIADISPEIRKKAEAATFVLTADKEGHAFANLTLVEFEINGKKEKYLVTSAHAVENGKPAFFRPKDWHKGDVPLQAEEFLRIDALDIALFTAPKELEGVEPLKAAQTPAKNNEKVYSVSFVPRKEESTGYIKDISSPEGILSSLWAEGGTCGSAILNSEGDVVGIRNYARFHPGLSKYFSLPNVDFFPEDAPVGIISDYLKYKLYGIDSARPVYVLGQYVFDIATSQSILTGPEGTRIVSKPNGTQFSFQRKVINNLESLWSLNNDFYKDKDLMIVILKNSDGSKEKINIGIKDSKVTGVNKNQLLDAPPATAPAAVNKSWVERQKDNLANWLENKFTLRFLDSGNGKTAADITVDNNYAENKTLLQDKTFIVVTQDKSGADNIISALQKYVPPEQIKYFPGVRPAVRYFISNDRVPVEKLVVLTDMNFDAEDTFEQHGSSLMNFKKESQEIPVIIINPGRSQLLEKFFEQGYDGLLSGGGAADDIAAFIKDKNLKPSQMPQAKMFTPEELDVIRFLEQDDLSKENLKDIRANDDKLQDIIYNFSDKVENDQNPFTLLMYGKLYELQHGIQDRLAALAQKELAEDTAAKPKSSPYQNLGFIAFDPQASAERWHAGTLKFFDVIKNLFIPAPAVMRFAASVGFASAPVQTIPSAVVMGMPGISSAQHAAKRTKYFWDDIDEVIARLESLNRMPDWNNFAERELYYDVNSLQSGDILNLSLQQKTKLNKLIEKYKTAAALAAAPKNNKPDGVSWSERLAAAQAKAASAAYAVKIASSPAEEDKLVNEFNDFISEHDRMPSPKQPGEKGLYLRVYRAMRDTKNPARAQKLKKIWDANISKSYHSEKRLQNSRADIEQTIRELTAFVEANKKFPPAKSSLYLKSMRIKNGIRQGVTPDDISAVEKLWRIDFDNTIAELEAYTLTYHQLPQNHTKYQNLYERGLALKEGRVESASEEQVKKARDIWDKTAALQNEEKIKKLTQKLKDFIAKYKRLPNDSVKGSAESKFYTALYIVKNNESGIYTAEQLAELNQMWDEYWHIARTNVVAETIKKLEVFTAANNRLPDGRKSDEWGLYNSGLAIKNGETKSATAAQQQYVSDIWDKYAMRRKKTDAPEKTAYAAANAAGSGLTLKEKPVKYSAAGRAADDFVIKMPAEAKPSETVPVNGGGNGKSEYIRSNGDIETIIARLEDFTAAKGRMPLWENADERDFYYDISGIKNGTIYATSQQIAKIRKISEVYNHTAAPADNGKPSEKKPWSERLENGKANKTAAALSSAEPVSKIISVAPASAAASPSVKPAAAVTIDKLVKELNDFISAHGRLPSSEQPGEKGLYLRVYRAMRNTENPARAARLQIIWDENISQSHYSAKRRQNGGDTVEQAVQELTKYVELNKEFPPAHSSLYLKSMAIKSGRRKEATPEQISAVEKLWRIDHDNTIAEFEDYVSKYGKMPQLLTESQPLYLRALALKNGKTVSASAEQVQKMKDVWDSSLARLNAEKINKLTEDLKNFIAANGRLPRDLEKGSDESRLYHAVYVVVNRASPYTAEQLAEIKDLWDKYWYIARPNSVAERIKKLEEFTSAHGRMPDNRKSGEWSLYSAALLIKNGVNKSASEEQRKHVAEIWDKYAVQHKADGAKQSPDADGNAAGVNLTSAEEPAKYSAAARAADDFVIKMPAAEPLPEVKTQEKIPDNDNVPPQNLPPPAYLSSKAEQSLGQERNIDDIPIAIRKKAQNATFVLVTSSDISTSIANISLVEFDINGKKEKYLVTSAHALEPGELAFFKHRNWPKDAQPIYAKEFLRINTLDIVLYTVPEELDGVEPLKASGIPAGNGDKVYSISVHNDNKESAGHIQDIFSPGGILSSMWAEEGGGCGIAMLNSAGEVTGIRNHKTVHPGLSKYFFLPTESLFPEDVPVSLISDYLKYKLYGIDSPRPVYVLGQHVFDILISQSVTDGYMAWYDKNGKKSESGAHRTQRTQGYKLINNLESLWKQLGEGYPKYEIELTLKNRGGSEEEISIEINGGKVTGLKKENLGTENQPQNTRFDKTALKSNAPISAGRYTYSLLPPFNILWSAAEFIYKKISALRTRGDNTRAAAAQTEEMFSAPAAEKPAKYVPDSRADDISAVTSAPVLREEETSAQALPPPDYLTSKSETSIWQERNINGISPEIRKKAEDAVFILHSSGEAWANITLAEFEIKDKTGKTETKTYLVTANHVVVSGEPALFRPKNWQKGEPLLHAEEFLRIPELDIALFQVPEELKGTEPLKAGETPARNGDRVYSVSALNHGKESSGYIKDINGTAGILSSLWADGTGTCGSPMVNTETGELEGIRNAKMEAPALSRHFGLDANDYFYFPYDVPAYIISDYISYKLYGVDSSRPVYVSGQKVFDIKTSQSAEDAVMRFEGKAVPKRGIKLVNNLESLWGRLGNNQDFKIEVTLRNSGGSKEKINIEIKDGKVINNSRAVAPAVTKADEEKSNSFQNLGIAFNQQARAEQWAADTWKFLDIIKNLFLPVPVIAKFVDGGGFAEASAETASSVEAPVVRNTAKRTKYFWYDIDEVIERLENLGRMPARENPKEKELYYDINSLTGGEVLNITPQQKSKLNKLIEKYKNPAAASTSAPKNNKQYGLTWAERRKAVKAKAEERALAAEKETKTIEAAPAASPVKEDGILAELNEFIAENGKLPGPKHLGERSLYLRLNRAMNNEKNPELAAAIKKIWEDNKSKSYQTDAYKHRHDKQIERTVRDLKKYVETNKDVPPFGTALNLRSLDIKSGRTKSATEEQIAEVKQLWTVTLDNNIKELEDFTAEHGRLPDSNKKEERALYAKMNALKKGDVVSALPEQIEKTKALWDKYSVPPGRKKAAPESVSPAAEQTEKTKKPRTKRTEEDIDNIIEKTREFAESNGRLPNTNIKGSEEDALYNAAHGILAGLGATSATEKQLAALQAIWDKYKNIARVAGVAETIKELKQFMSDHEGRLPDSRKEDEWALYNAAWKIKTGRNQFATAEERKITTELWNVYVIPRGRQKGISKKGNKSSSDKTEKAADAKPAAEESGILGELNKFISENGRLPSSKRQDEHAFYVRINRAMNNEKKPEQAAAIKKVWEDYKRNSDSGILGELNEFVAENGRLPSSEQPSEKSLYFKVYRAIKDEEKPEQAAAIKKVWEDNKYKSYQSDMFKQRNDDTIAATVQELEEYVKLNNKLPPLDSSLYSRSFDIKSGATKTATPEQVNTVKKLWGITVDNYIKELEDFIAEHGRMPNSNGGEEHALYEKLYKIKKGKTLASDEQQKKVQDIWDKWAGQKKGISNNDLPVSAVVPAAENKNADTAPSVTQLEEDGAAKPAKYSFAEHADGFTIKSGPVLPEEQVKSEESVYWINPSRNQAKIETMLPEVRDSKAAEYYSEPAHRTAYYRAEQIYELMKKTQRYYRNSNGIIKSSIKYFLVYNTLNRMMAETIAGLPLPDAYYELKKDALADLFNVIKRPPSAEYPSMTAVLKGFYGAQPLPPEWEERRKEFLESKLGDYFIYLANAVKGGLATEEEVDVFFKALDEAKGEYYPGIIYMDADFLLAPLTKVIYLTFVHERTHNWQDIFLKNLKDRRAEYILDNYHRGLKSYDWKKFYKENYENPDVRDIDIFYWDHPEEVDARAAEDAFFQYFTSRKVKPSPAAAPQDKQKVGSSRSLGIMPHPPWEQAKVWHANTLKFFDVMKNIFFPAPAASVFAEGLGVYKAAPPEKIAGGGAKLTENVVAEEFGGAKAPEAAAYESPLSPDEKEELLSMANEGADFSMSDAVASRNGYLPYSEMPSISKKEIDRMSAYIKENFSKDKNSVEDEISAAAAQSPASPEEEIEAVLKDKTLIFADDEENRFKSYGEVFKPYVKEIKYFPRAGAAINYMRENKNTEKFIVITDIFFEGGRNGFDVLHEAKSIDKNIPVFSLNSRQGGFDGGFNGQLIAEVYYPERMAITLEKLSKINTDGPLSERYAEDLPDKYIEAFKFFETQGWDKKTSKEIIDNYILLDNIFEIADENVYEDEKYLDLCHKIDVFLYDKYPMEIALKDAEKDFEREYMNETVPGIRSFTAEQKAERMQFLAQERIELNKEIQKLREE